MTTFGYAEQVKGMPNPLMNIAQSVGATTAAPITLGTQLEQIVVALRQCEQELRGIRFKVYGPWPEDNQEKLDEPRGTISTLTIELNTRAQSMLNVLAELNKSL